VAHFRCYLRPLAGLGKITKNFGTVAIQTKIQTRALPEYNTLVLQSCNTVQSGSCLPAFRRTWCLNLQGRSERPKWHPITSGIGNSGMANKRANQNTEPWGQQGSASPPGDPCPLQAQFWLDPSSVFLGPVPPISPAAVPACPTSIVKTKAAVYYEMGVNTAKLHYAKSWRHCPYNHVQMFLHHSAVNVRWPANSICRRRCRGGTALRQVETRRGNAVDRHSQRSPLECNLTI